MDEEKMILEPAMNGGNSSRDEDEMEPVETQGVFQLRTPIYINGSDIPTWEMPYDFDSLTGNDMVRIRKLLQQKGFVITGPSSMDNTYLLHVFGRAVEKATNQKIAMTDVCAMKIKDCDTVVDMTRRFFLKD